MGRIREQLWHKPLTSADFQALVLTAHGEARGEPPGGIEAVVHVVLNRYRDPKARYGDTIQGVCTRPRQFSCWNHDDPNSALLARLDWTDPGLRQTALRVLHALDEPDSTNGALHYMSKHLLVEPPKWARGRTPCAFIGGHVFFNNIDD